MALEHFSVSAIDPVNNSLFVINDSDMDDERFTCGNLNWSSSDGDKDMLANARDSTTQQMFREWEESEWESVCVCV